MSTKHYIRFQCFRLLVVLIYGASLVLTSKLEQKSVHSFNFIQTKGLFSHPRQSSLLQNKRQQELENTGDIRKRNDGKKIICYYGSWATYRSGTGRVSVNMINPFHCTYIIYSFFGLNSKFELISLDPWNDFAEPEGLGSLRELTKLRTKNPNLKVLISVGGWNEGSRNYSRMAFNSWGRAKFINSAVAFLNQHQLDGLDLDWEYPNFRGGGKEDKRNYVDLVRELKWAFKPRDYLLTAAVPAGKETIDGGFDVSAAVKYLDVINLMTYDFHGAWDGRTGLNAPLYSDEKDDVNSVDWSVNYWLKLGAPREKLMLGLGFYGRSFTLNAPQFFHGLGGLAGQSGRPGFYTKSKGTLSYHEICLNLSRNWWKQVRSSRLTSTCYAYGHRDQWVSFDDSQSLRNKLRYAQAMDLGGVMIWSIDQDDFNGACGEGKQPLLKVVLEEINF